MSGTLMCGFLVISIRFDENNIYWMWSEQIQIPIILGISAVLFGLFWIIEERKSVPF